MLEWGGVIRRRVGGRTPLAIMFFLCSFWPMEQIDTSRVADTILAAPGWARLGITAPASHVRTDAAHELARVIVAAIEAGGFAAPAAEQPADRKSTRLNSSH